jgi:hypothetical protein
MSLGHIWRLLLDYWYDIDWACCFQCDEEGHIRSSEEKVKHNFRFVGLDQGNNVLLNHNTIPLGLG